MSSDTSSESAPRELRLRRDRLEWREVDGEIVALEMRKSIYLSANSTGTFIWRALDSGTTREALRAGLVERYGIDRDRAQADVDRFLAALRERDLLEE